MEPILSPMDIITFMTYAGFTTSFLKLTEVLELSNVLDRISAQHEAAQNLKSRTERQYRVQVEVTRCHLMTKLGMSAILAVASIILTMVPYIIRALS